MSFKFLQQCAYIWLIFVHWCESTHDAIFVTSSVIKSYYTWFPIEWTRRILEIEIVVYFGKRKTDNTVKSFY